ncbi:MAG: S-layer homology domain-containing protein [Clostridia bacterium]|nr:S-layer homology domain-containing protein [Clostridia bacterium]
MRRFLLMFISFSMALGMTVLPAGADSVSAARSEAVDEAVSLLAALDILSDGDFLTFESERKITRGEFACLAAELAGDINIGPAMYFYDVPENHYAYEAVSLLASLNIVNGVEDKRYRPDELMGINAAYTILTRLLSYERYAEVCGGYPSGYIAAAQKLKLSKGVASGEYITMGDAAVLLKNTLLAETMDFESMSGNDITYKGSGESLLTRSFDSYYNTGSVTAVRDMGIYGSKNLSDGEIEVDGILYETGEQNLSGFFGRRVKYVYTEKKKDERKIIWMRDEGKNAVISFFSDGENCTFDKNSMKLSYYNEDGKDEDAIIAENATVIYNGENYSGDISEVFSDTKSEITLISEENSSRYGVVIVTSYITVKADAVDYDNEIIYGDNREAYDFSKGNIYIYDEYMQKIRFSDIANNDIVNISISVSGENIKAIISRNTVSGKISEISQDGGYYNIKIDNKLYKYGGSNTSLLKTGNFVTLYLDSFLYVHEIDITQSESSFAYIIRVSWDTDIDGLVFKILAEDGEVMLRRAANKISIDGKSCTGSENDIKAMDELCHQLVILKTNTDGEIIKIDTVNGTNLYRDQERRTVLYKGNSRKLGTKIIMNSQTKVFSVPADDNIDTADESEFAVKKYTDFSNDTQYNAESYMTENKPGDFADAVLVHGYDWGAGTISTACLLIENITSVFNEEENTAVSCIEGYQGTKAVRLVCDPSCDVSGYLPGDAVTIKVNNGGQVKDINLVYRIGMTVDGSNYGNTFNAPRRILIVRANDRINSLVKVGYESGGSFDEVFDLNGAPILVFDSSVSKGEKIRKGSYADALTYKTAGDNCSVMLIQKSYEDTKLVIIYKQ